MTYAVAGPSGDPGAQDRAKRPVEVYHLTLKETAGGKRELPRTDTEQFSLVGVSWTGAVKRLDGTAQVRTRGLASGEWGAWQNLEVNIDPPEDPEAGMRGASEPLWVGPSDGVQVQVVHEDGTTGALPNGLEADLVDPGVVTDAETKATEPAAFVAEESSPAATPTRSTTPADGTTATPTDAQSATSPTPTDPTATAAPTDSASVVRGIYACLTAPMPGAVRKRAGSGESSLGRRNV